MDNEFIEKYSNLIYKITHYFEGYPHKEDLYQAGCVGLMMAYQNYNEEYGTKFSTYAYTYIIGEMNKLVREDKGIKVSKNITSLNSKIERAKYVLAQQLMKEPTLQELADFLNIEEEILYDAINMSKTLVSLDTPIKKDTKEMTISDIISIETMDINDLIAFKEELNKLSPFEKSLIEQSFIEAKSQSEVAHMYGMNQVQVSRTLKKIKEKIKKELVA